MGRNAVQILMTNGKEIVQITPRARISFKNKNILIVLHTKIIKLNDKKNIDIVVKMLQVNDVTSKAISISLR